jgi:hypothetical protein
VPTVPPAASRSVARAVRWLGFASVAGWVAWAASRFEARPLWPVSLREAAAILAWSALLQIVLVVVEALTRDEGRPCWADYARAYALMLFCGWTFLWYVNPRRVGPLDAQWYQNVTTDFLTQARAGTFPSLVGSTVYAFNGAVHPFRSAPWQFVLADGVDILSGRALAPVAVEHITAIASYGAAVLILYVGFARARGGARSTALLFALGLATSPAVTVPFFQFDMYMTMTALPAMAAAMLCAQRVVDDDSIVASGWLGVFLAALWYCHPPMALLTGMTAGAMAAAGLAVRGPTVRRAACAAAALATFAALAAPYFLSMSELAQSEQPLLANVAMPVAGLGLCLLAMAGFLRSRRLPWLALVPTALLCLRDFQPSLVPFASLFVAAMLGAAWATRRGTRRHDAAWVALCALAAAILAAALFPGTSIPGLGAWVPHDWSNFFEPITPSRTRVQPGYLLWFLVAGMVALAFATPSTFAQLAAAAALVLVVSLGFCGGLSAFLWRNVPAAVNGVVATTYDLRLIPAMSVVAITGGYFWFTSLRPGHPALWRVLHLVILVLVPWMLWEHAVVLWIVRDFSLDLEQTAIHNRPENVALERYSWDLLLPPRFINWGVMDPALETRFWSDSDHTKAMIDPDQMERAMEAPGQKPVGLVATPVPTGRDWLTLDPRIEIDPGRRVLLRFDFLGKYVDNGYLIVKGQTLYREYRLPSSGRDYAFGFDPGNTRTLSLWNSGSARESVQLMVLRYGAHALDPPGPDPYWLMYLTPYDPARAPIELRSLTPLKLRVDAPTAGYVETFRSWIPGYRVYVDGREQAVHSSRNALVSVRVAPGPHDVWVRFAGTVRLHTALRWAFAGWVAAALSGALALRVMARRAA